MNSHRLNEVALPHFIPASLINALDVDAVIKLLPHLFYVHRLVCAIACHFSRESSSRTAADDAVWLLEISDHAKGQQT